MGEVATQLQTDDGQVLIAEGPFHQYSGWSEQQFFVVSVPPHDFSTRQFGDLGYPGVKTSIYMGDAEMKVHLLQVAGDGAKPSRDVSFIVNAVSAAIDAAKKAHEDPQAWLTELVEAEQ